MTEHQRWFWRMDEVDRNSIGMTLESVAKFWKRYEILHPIEAARELFRSRINCLKILEEYRP